MASNGQPPGLLMFPTSLSADAEHVSTFRKLLLALLLLSLTGSAFGAGTFASFTASTTNVGSTFASGSLVLSNEVATAGACFSSGDTDTIGDGATDANEDELAPNSGTCDALFDGLAANAPGDFAEVNLTLENVGNVDGNTIVGEATACAPGDAPETGGAASETIYHGLGDPCGYFTIQVQEYSDATRLLPSKCLYPAGVVTCLTANTLTQFVTDTALAPMEVNTAADVLPNTPRYLKVRIDFPESGTPGAENQYMGRTAAFGVLWTLEQ